MDKILIIEDEVKLRDELKLFLNNNGYDVDVLSSFDNSLEQMFKSDANLILLDINLPGVDGNYLCKEFRKQKNTPIIIVTSKNSDIDELTSLYNGADDHICKPYNPQILLARINRVLSRNISSDKILSYKNIRFNLSKSSIENDNKEVNLSRNELKLFNILLENKSKIISRDELINYLWDNGDYLDDNTLSVNINRLRSKLEELDLHDVLLTKRNQGYILL